MGVNGYIIQSAVDCAGQEVQDASTIAHEYGHVLGLPDYYHPTDADAGSFGRRWVLGCWGLMAAGAWGCGRHGEDRGAFGPTHLSARSKSRLSWIEYEVAEPGLDREYVLRPIQASGRALRVPMDGEGREQLVLEYRTREGFDAELPAEGVLVYRQDFLGSLRPEPGTSQRYFLTLLERDDDGGLLRNTLEGGDRGVAGDAWGGGDGPQKLHGLTSPGTLRWDGSSSGVVIHSIRVEGGVARVRLSRSALPGIALPAEPLTADPVNPFEATLTAGGGAMPYTLQAALPPGFEAEVDEDEIRVTGAVEGDEGVLELRMRLVDAEGAASGEVAIPVLQGPWVAAEASLLEPFIGGPGPALTEAERSYLDFLGNRNGIYDVGDLRAWLRDGTTSPGG